MMNMLTESRHAGEFISSEGNGFISREKITLASGSGIIESGTILGKQNIGDVAAVNPGERNTGNGTVGALITGNKVEIGTYKLTASEATKFELIAPSGTKLAGVTADTAYSGGHLNFTITSGDTAFAKLDVFNIVVSKGNNIFVPLKLSADDGTQNAAGILYARLDATSSSATGVAIVRSSEVKKDSLIWPKGITNLQKQKAQVELEEKNVILR